MKKTTLIFVILIVANIGLLGQRSYKYEEIRSDYKKNIMRNSNDTILRQIVVDSIVNEIFWDVSASYMASYSDCFRKTDFSDYAKEKLLSYFNRTLPNEECQEIIDECKMRMAMDSNKIRVDAESKGVPFDSLFSQKLKKEIDRDIDIVSSRARSYVSPIYARLLGWLDYKPAIPILEAVLKDSIKNKGYAKEHKDEFVLNCKLALARMGNKKYENEILLFYNEIDLDCSNNDYLVPINNLFYINTRASINYVIKLTNTDKIYERPYMYGFINQCSPKKMNLLYLASVILNYPIIYEYDEIKDLVIQHSYTYEFEPFYEKQCDELLKWLNRNKNTYKINTEKLFMP
jgi:hypothetical protein